MVVTVPTGSDVAYTQYAEVSLNENVDLIVAEGDDFVTDILGIINQWYFHINRYWW